MNKKYDYIFRMIVVLAFILLSSKKAWSEISISDVYPVDVTSSGFSVIWQTSGYAIPGITVFSDPAGNNNITNQLEVTLFPLMGNNPQVTTEFEKEEDREALREKAMTLGLMKIGIGGCSPETTYYYQVHAENLSGEKTDWPVTGPFPSVTTFFENSFVSDSKQVLATMVGLSEDENAAGWLVIASNTESPYGISACIGDGAGINQAFLNISNFFDYSGVNWTPNGTKGIILEIKGSELGTISKELIIDFSESFSVSTIYPVEIEAGDTTPPAISCPQNILAECGTQIDYIVQATDDYDPDPIISCSHSSGIIFPFGDTSVECSATDDFGNSSMCNFIVSIVDETVPVSLLSIEEPKFSENPTFVSQNTQFLFTATDDCSGVSQKFVKISDGSFEPAMDRFTLSQLQVTANGNYTIYFYSTDNSENEEMVKSLEIFLDTEPPVIETFSVSPNVITPDAPDSLQWINQSLFIDYELTDDTNHIFVTLQIRSGESIVWEYQETIISGSTSHIEWNGKDMASEFVNPGIYIISLVAGDPLGQNIISEEFTVEVKTYFNEKVISQCDECAQMYPDITQDKVVWQDNRNGDWDIYIYDFSQQTERNLTPKSADQTHPAINGNKVVWQDAGNGNEDIYLYDIEYEQEFIIEDDLSTQIKPSISGDWIVWQDDRSGNWDIYAYNLETNEKINITEEEADQINPSISGSIVAWEDYRHGSGEIYIYNLDTREETRITTDDYNQTTPAVFEGKITWVDHRFNNKAIFLYDLTTGIESQVSDSLSDYGQPSLYEPYIIYTDYSQGIDNPNPICHILNTGHFLLLTDNIAPQEEPDVFGHKVVWQDYRTGHWRIYTTDIRGYFPDEDQDGVVDDLDICPDTPQGEIAGKNGCSETQQDSDNDGIPDITDNCPQTPNPDQADTDDDGRGDACDGCPADAMKTEPGICGCGVTDIDTDNDGTMDCEDECPNDPLKTQPGICGCGVTDIDTDNDGTMDCEDECPNDPLKTQPGICGCGVADTDTDNDSILDCIDNCVNTYNPDQTDTDGDGIGDACQVIGNPVADAGNDQEVTEGISVIFNGTGSFHSDPARRIISYDWDFDYDGVYFDIDAVGPIVTKIDGYTLPESQETKDFTIGLMVTDDSIPPLTSMDTAIVTVSNNNVAPVADPGGPYLVAVGDDITLDASGSYDENSINGANPIENPLTTSGYDEIVSYQWDLDGDGLYGIEDTPADPEGGTVTVNFGEFIGNKNISLKVTDSFGRCSAQSINMTTIEILNLYLIVPVDPQEVGTVIDASATFSDIGTGDTHMAVWNWGDGSTSAGTVTESNGSGSVTGSHAYTSPGVYIIQLTVTDNDSSISQSVFQLMVVYDPEGGFVTGGGWINSPAGAYRPYPDLTGKANFGFVSKYKKGTTIPIGNTQFHFQAGDFNFHSDTYEWLVVNQAGTNAQFKGSGTVNGELAPTGEAYKFMIWASDLYPDSDDTFRIKIWFEDSDSEIVVYDNGTDQSISGGNIKIHTN